ncbi:TonB family protein [Pedobacter sp.]|uniref:TonB family protein n=1 Tax=Pedobacter sp. TaxID=1411316 RepID=UPI003BA990CD
MKELLLSILFYGMIVTCQAQKLDTLYYDSKWKSADKKDFTYYRLTEFENNLYVLKDYYKDGNIQMMGFYKSVEPEIKHGKFTWYYPNGGIRQKSFYQDDSLKRTNAWNANGLSIKYPFLADVYIEGTYTKPDMEPQFPGGEIELKKFIKANQKDSKILTDQKISGTVVLNFKISAKGKINSIKIEKSLNSILDDEAVRVLKIMPNWFPGCKNGVNVQKRATQIFYF